MAGSRKKVAADYYQRNKETIKAKSKATYWAMTEEQREAERKRNREWYKKNREHKKQQAQEYYEQNRKSVLARVANNKKATQLAIDTTAQKETHAALIRACDIAEGRRPVDRAKIMKCEPGCMEKLFAKTGRVDL